MFFKNKNSHINNYILLDNDINSDSDSNISNCDFHDISYELQELIPQPINNEENNIILDHTEQNIQNIQIIQNIQKKNLIYNIIPWIQNKFTYFNSFFTIIYNKIKSFIRIKLFNN